MDKKLKQDLKVAFRAPAPTKKNEFLSNLPYPKTNKLDFFFTQIWYIRKRFWCLSILIVIALILLTQVFDTTLKTIGVLSSFLPFLVLLSVLEISRSTSYNMAEVEMSCRYHLGKITLVRLSLIGSFHFIIVFCMIMIFANRSEYSFWLYTLYSITPFLLCSYLSYFIINHFNAKDTTYICGGVTGVISSSTFFLIMNNGMINSQRLEFGWNVVLISIVVLLIKEIKKLVKRTEELQWNY